MIALPRRQTAAILVTLCCAWFVDRPAAAQAGSTFDPRKEARIRFGPLYVTPTLQLRDIGFDSNVFDSATQPVSDFTATLVPRADVWVPIARRALITTSTAAALVYYRTQSAARSVDPDALIRGDVYARRVTFFADNRYLKTRERSFEVDAALARRTEDAASAGAVVQIGARLSAEVTGYYRRVGYDEDGFLGSSLRDSLNRAEQGVRVSVRHKVTPLTTLVGRAETQRARFEFSPVRDTDGVRLTMGAEFSPRALISGSFEAGLRDFDGRDTALPGFRGLVAKGVLSYRLRDATVLGFTWDRDAVSSFELLWPYAVLNAVGGRVRRQIRGQVDAIFAAQRATYDFRPFSSTPSQPVRRDVTVSYSLDVGYRLSRDVRVGVAATTWNRDSTDLLRAYRDLRVGLSLSYALPR